MKRKVIKGLEAKRSQRIEEASKKLLENNDLRGAEKELAWIRTAGALLNSAQSPWSRLSPFVIGALCVLLVGGVWIIHLPLFGFLTPGITCDVITDNVTLSLSKDWSFLEPFTVNNQWC